MMLSKTTTRSTRCLMAMTALIFVFVFPMNVYSQARIDARIGSDGPLVRAPVLPPLPPYEAPGPPSPSDNATGSLKISVIHDELKRVYDDCDLLSNNAFDGIDPEPGDTTHDHLKCGDCKLTPRTNWRCGGYRMGINGTYDEILKDRCDSVTMAADEKYELVDYEKVVQEDFFKGENEKEWYVKLPSYFFYNLEFNDFLNIDRNLY